MSTTECYTCPKCGSRMGILVDRFLMCTDLEQCHYIMNLCDYLATPCVAFTKSTSTVSPMTFRLQAYDTISLRTLCAGMLELCGWPRVVDYVPRGSTNDTPYFIAISPDKWFGARGIVNAYGTTKGFASEAAAIMAFVEFMTREYDRPGYDGGVSQWV